MWAKDQGVFCSLETFSLAPFIDETILFLEAYFDTFVENHVCMS